MSDPPLERAMDINKKSVRRWRRMAAYVGLMAVMLACASIGSVPAVGTRTAIPTPTGAPLLRLENGAVKVQGENADWVPVAGESTFDLTGRLESTDPWMVTGNTFATRETTQIAEGLEAGDLVRVRGVILDDGTWLANSIEPARTQAEPTIILIGKVDSTDPWVVNGITLNVTADTVVTGEIKPDMLVRVEILLAEDGTWEVLSIAPLSSFTEIPGCATVTATVVSVNGKEIQFAGWPTLRLGDEVKVEDEAGKEATLRADQNVLVVVCPGENGQFTITIIIVLKTTEESIPSDGGNGNKVLICHKPNKKGGHTLSVASPAVPAHLAHGDTLGPCP